MVIPHERLDSTTLQSLIEAFVTREGTDYGHRDVPLAEKVEQVRRQLERGQVLIVFDSDTESINLLPREQVDEPWKLEA